MSEPEEHRPPSHTSYDAVVVGAGPNGLAAAVELARAGWHTLLIEAHSSIGGASRSADLTRPGFVHDVGSAIHPLGLASPYFRTLPLERYGLEWVHPEIPLAHPLEGGEAAVLSRSLHRTAHDLGRDESAYRSLLSPLVDAWKDVLDEVMQPLLHLPRHPVTIARFGLRALWPATWLARRVFATRKARALFAGIAAHQTVPLSSPGSSAMGLMLSMAGHTVGWPFPRGGASTITDALAAYFQELGGEIVTGWHVGSLDELPAARCILLNLTPRQVLHVAGDRLPSSYCQRLRRYRYGPSAFKIDYALTEPIPWAADECRRAGTVHVGGTLDEIARAEAGAARGEVPEEPFILLAQQSLFDETRAPEGHHTAWAYCHVPFGSTTDMTTRIEAQIERFAPGFQDIILERSVLSPRKLEAVNPNLVGGDINSGSNTLWQLLARPILSPVPYRIPADGLYLCSASTPPGGGVHGMCGYHAARTALRDLGVLGEV